jgi:hypothetical protein
MYEVLERKKSKQCSVQNMGKRCFDAAIFQSTFRMFDEMAHRQRFIYDGSLIVHFSSQTAVSIFSTAVLLASFGLRPYNRSFVTRSLHSLKEASTSSPSLSTSYSNTNEPSQ